MVYDDLLKDDTDVNKDTDTDKHDANMKDTKESINDVPSEPGQYVLGEDGAAIPVSDAGLAVAVAVQEEIFDDGPVTFAKEIDLLEKIPLHKTRRFWIIAVVLVLIIGGIVIGVTLGVTKKIEDQKRETNAPSVASSSAPSTARDGLGIWQELNKHSSIDLIKALDIDSNDDNVLEEVFQLRETPQFLAADWIVNEDIMELQLDDPKLVQRFVLATLFFSTDGPEWNNMVNETFIADYNASSIDEFLAVDDECEWFGISCAEGMLISINMESNNLNGTIPNEITRLDTLQSLILPTNHLRGTIPENIGDLTELLQLSFGDNELTGTIPASLYSLKQIDTIELDLNLFSGTISPAIGNLTNLKGIYLFDNFFSGSLPSTIGNLRSLRWFLGDTNFFTGTIPFFGNVILTEIIMYSNNFNGTIPPELSSAKNLEILDFDLNDLHGTIPEELYDMDRLWYMRFLQNSLTGTISTRIGELSDLSVLDLGGNLLTGPIPEELGNLPFLEQVELRNNALTGTIPTTFGNLTSLHTLWVHYNRLTGEVPLNICDLKRFHTLSDVMVDCHDIFNDPLVLCDCCNSCCDPIEEKCEALYFSAYFAF